MKKNKDFLPLNVENHMLDNQDLESSTEFASAERSSVEELIRQNKEWSAQKSTQVLSDAIPDLLLILNQNRQIVYSNGNCVKFGRLENTSECLGLRPGELLNCKHAFESKGGCGTTKFCSTCGAAKAILESLNGKKDVEECKIDRRNDQSMMELRVWTTPVQLSGEQFSVFTVHDISIEKEHARLLERVQKLAVLDPLTEVFNRRAFFEAANREITRAIRYHNPFSIIMIDLDRFKQINDTYGHPAGDAVIKEITRLIQRNLREIDTLARYGGDEFIVLLPETGLVGGQKVADRIMQASDEDVYLYKDFEIPMAFSAGVAEFQFEVDHDIDDVISRADKELYSVKSKRRQIQID